MGNLFGIWVSHKVAKIVQLSLDGTSTLLIIESNVESKRKSTGGTPPKTPYSHGGVSVTKYSDRVAHQLHEFYSNIISKVTSADKIYILGPGLAKKELEKEIKQRKDLAPKLGGIEPSDKMTNPQLIAKVKSYFGIVK
ncbi:MAG: hypothetical protein ACE5JB_15815 [bacterium]